ncbi:MAG: peptidoglycan DD-metalloendopeptidase family protein [Cyclobacteriaceae bacterium]
MFLRSINLTRFFLLVLLLSCGVLAHGQKTKEQLEAEKRENLRKIAEAEKILSETKSEKKVTVGQLTALNQQIFARESLISSINEQIVLLNGEINDLSIVSNALEADLLTLKEEYASMIYQSYKANHGFSMLTYLFSAKTFNQLFMRLKYLEQYTEARKLQADQIVEVTKQLNLQRSDVEIKREEQKTLLTQQLRENKKLLALKKEKDRVILALGKKEKEIRTEMANRKKSIERLDRLIADLIKAEMEKNKSMSSLALEDAAILTERFEAKKDNLQWPVTTGFITTKFGRQSHPVLKNIFIESNGIDIQTNENQDVHSVFDGEVKIKAFLPGYNNVVIVKHGNYLTVYSKLKEVNVKKGQILRSSEVIGKVHTNADGISEVHFEVWKDTQKLDPEKWLIN